MENWEWKIIERQKLFYGKLSKIKLNKKVTIFSSFEKKNTTLFISVKP